MSGCAHRWKIERPNGAYSRGLCSKCDLTKAFANSFTTTAWASKESPRSPRSTSSVDVKMLDAFIDAGVGPGKAATTLGMGKSWVAELMRRRLRTREALAKEPAPF